MTSFNSSKNISTTIKLLVLTLHTSSLNTPQNYTSPFPYQITLVSYTNVHLSWSILLPHPSPSNNPRPAMTLQSICFEVNLRDNQWWQGVHKWRGPGLLYFIVPLHLFCDPTFSYISYQTKLIRFDRVEQDKGKKQLVFEGESIIK